MKKFNSFSDMPESVFAGYGKAYTQKTNLLQRKCSDRRISSVTNEFILLEQLINPL
jgi:hypothetical protein